MKRTSRMTDEICWEGLRRIPVHNIIQGKTRFKFGYLEITSQGIAYQFKRSDKYGADRFRSSDLDVRLVLEALNAANDFPAKLYFDEGQFHAEYLQGARKIHERGDSSTELLLWVLTGMFHSREISYAKLKLNLDAQGLKKLSRNLDSLFGDEMKKKLLLNQT